MAFSLTCPNCRAILKSAASVPAGKKVKCAKCDTSFEAPPLEDTAVTAVPAAAAPRQRESRPAATEPDRSDEDPPRKRRQDEDDAARSRKRRDNRNDADDDQPRSARTPKRKRRRMGAGMLIGVLLAGGAMLAVACAGCGGLGYWVYTMAYGPGPIVGTWEQTNHPLGLKVINTFGADGMGSTKVANVLISYKYRLDGNLLEIESDQPIQAPFAKGLNFIERYTVAFNGNEMVLTAIDNRPFGLREQRFRRVK